MKFISVDPSLNNTAVVVGVIYNDKIVPQEYTLIQTHPPKKGEPKIKNLVYRVRHILKTLKEIVDRENADCCFAELPTGSQSSTASIGVGVSCSIISVLCENTTYVTASEVKISAVGNKNATKKEIMKYCEDKYPDFNFERKKDGTLVEGRMEHVCDAICIAEAGFKKL